MTNVMVPTRVRLGGTTIDLCGVADVFDAVRARLAADDGPPLAVSSANLDHIHHFGRRGSSHADVDFGAASPRWMVLLDGIPLVGRARRLTGRDWPRLAGSDLLAPLLEDAERIGARVGFLGGRQEMHTKLAVVLAERYPALKVAGMWAPERAVLNDHVGARALAHTAGEALVDLLVVGLGKPRQEMWIQRYGQESGARVLLAFGAAADFVAGEVSRAPVWVQRAGAEWLYRLFKEPRRLGRRYCLQSPAALWHLWNDPALAPEARR